MPENVSENKMNRNETISLQLIVFRFVVLVSVLLIVVPTMPMLISNLAYSFSGDKPKIYWYLSRSGGFVTLSILWVAMALGIGITNKMARLWPGAPTAFAVHQYTSLLGLAFAAYHGLVLMGDHFVDFSLPRLATPFSIAYKTIWIGLGQVCFYVWLIVVLSFYVRRFIGQKTWRVIHYVNFVTYSMGFLHGLMSGTDSVANWARGYYWASGGGLVGLLVYRIYDTKLKGKISLPTFSFKRAPKAMATSDAVAATPAIFRVRSVPPALLREQANKSTTSSQTRSEPVISQIPILDPHEQKDVLQPVSEEKLQQTIGEQIVAQKDSAPVETPTVESAPEKTKAKRNSNSPMEEIHTDKIRVRIFREPTTRPIPELQKSAEIIQEELHALFIRVKQSFRAIPVEPTTPNRYGRFRALEE